MTKLLAISVAAALCLSACGGGGGDSAAPAPTAKIQKLSFYGNPLGTAPKATAHAFAAVARDASAPVATSDPAATTVQTLQAALAAQGVTAAVTVQVMNGTTLHQIIMGESNGLPPTPDQFKTDPSEYLVANFTLDDMVTPGSDPTQNAAMQQFKQDLETFIQRAHVSGKLVLVVLPIPTCDVVPNYATQGGANASTGLMLMISQAAISAGGFPVGGLSSNIQSPDGTITNDFTAGHLGADCRTPDAYLLNAQTQAVAKDIASRLVPASAPAAASSPSTP
jgi:hypothetical protein